ncbi:MAG: hypothetical protein ACKPKO_19855 [Candidatus Fonsibacter sp.]
MFYLFDFDKIKIFFEGTIDMITIMGWQTPAQTCDKTATPVPKNDKLKSTNEIEYNVVLS